MSKDNQRERQGKVYDLAFARASMSRLSIRSLKTGCSWWDSRPCPGSAFFFTLSLRLGQSEARNHVNIGCLFSYGGWAASLALPRANWGQEGERKMIVEIHTQTQYDGTHWAREMAVGLKSLWNSGIAIKHYYIWHRVAFFIYLIVAFKNRISMFGKSNGK